jgi:hypothetical protein
VDVIDELLKSRIRDGAAWLDEREEGWRDRVQVVDLELSSACRCVLGQVFSSDARALYERDPGEYKGFRPYEIGQSGTTYSSGFNYALNFLDEMLSPEEAQRMGFDHDAESEYTWHDMTVAWQEYLKGEWT